MSAIASGTRPLPSLCRWPSVPASLWPRGAKVLAGAALAIGVIGLLGWLTHDAAPRSFIGGQAQIKANTAIALVLAGGAALIEASRRARKAHAQARDHAWHRRDGPISLATLIESLTRADLGIDRLLFADVVRPGAPHAGRMAPSTAIAFLLIGTTIVLTAVQRRPLLRQIFALGAAVIALVALLGYASDAPSLYGFAASTKMALPTALGAADACVWDTRDATRERTDGVLHAALARRPDGHPAASAVIVIPTIARPAAARGDEARTVRYRDRRSGSCPY